MLFLDFEVKEKRVLFELRFSLRSVLWERAERLVRACDLTPRYARHLWWRSGEERRVPSRSPERSGEAQRGNRRSGGQSDESRGEES